MLERIDSELSYGDSRSEWIRQAIAYRMEIDPILDELYETYQRKEREAFVREAVRKEVDRVKEERN